MRWIIIAFLVLVACTPEPQKREIDLIDIPKINETPVIDTPEPELKNLSNIEYLNLSREPAEWALKCDLGNQHFLKSKFVYHINNIGEEVIYSPIGSYTRHVGSKRWTLRPFNNKEGPNAFTKTVSYMLEKKYPNDEVITCMEDHMLPKEFERFIGKHVDLFVNVTVEQLEDTKWG